MINVPVNKVQRSVYQKLNIFYHINFFVTGINIHKIKKRAFGFFINRVPFVHTPFINALYSRISFILKQQGKEITIQRFVKKYIPRRICIVKWCNVFQITLFVDQPQVFILILFIVCNAISKLEKGEQFE